MKIKTSYFLTAENNKRLIKEGKDIGTAVWFAPDIDISMVENIGSKEERTMIFPDNNMILKNKNTQEYSFGVWSENQSEWEEVDIKEYEKILLQE